MNFICKARGLNPGVVILGRFHLITTSGPRVSLIVLSWEYHAVELSVQKKEPRNLKAKLRALPLNSLETNKMSALKFCSKCNNLLYPKEDKEHKILLYACRNCDHEEVADNNIVYIKKIHHSIGEETPVVKNVAADPTLPRTKSVRCAQCNHGEAVFYQGTVSGEEGMALFFVCCNPTCANQWRD